MANKARNYTDQTLKLLYALSGNQCSFPDCTKVLVNPKNAKDSNICHIEGANEGSERYNASMTDKQRADYENLILLCIQHHDETNDVNKYTVDILKKMKSDHESNFLNHKINNNPSMLLNTINAISNINLEDIDESGSLNVVDPNYKMEYNSIKINFSLIQMYKVYHKKINTLYDELESQGSIKKEKLLSTIKLLYTRIKGEYVLNYSNPIEIIRIFSDNIIDDIYNELYLKLSKSSLWEEDIILGIRLIMVDAFIRCKILEEPPVNDSK